MTRDFETVIWEAIEALRALRFYWLSLACDELAKEDMQKAHERFQELAAELKDELKLELK